MILLLASVLHFSFDQGSLSSQGSLLEGNVMAQLGTQGVLKASSMTLSADQELHLYAQEAPLTLDWDSIHVTSQRACLAANHRDLSVWGQVEIGRDRMRLRAERADLVLVDEKPFQAHVMRGANPCTLCSKQGGLLAFQEGWVYFPQQSAWLIQPKIEDVRFHMALTSDWLEITQKGSSGFEALFGTHIALESDTLQLQALGTSWVDYDLTTRQVTQMMMQACVDATFSFMPTHHVSLSIQGCLHYDDHLLTCTLDADPDTYLVVSHPRGKVVSRRCVLQFSSEYCLEKILFQGDVKALYTLENASPHVKPLYLLLAQQVSVDMESLLWKIEALDHVICFDSIHGVKMTCEALEAYGGHQLEKIQGIGPVKCTFSQNEMEQFNEPFTSTQPQETLW